MNIRRLPSGNWNVRCYDYTDENGVPKMSSWTFPTKAEAIQKGLEYDARRGTLSNTNLTLRQVCYRYFELSQSLSPSTLAGYEKDIKYSFQDIMDEPVSKLNKEVLQRAINKEAKRKAAKGNKVISPKTVHNEYGTIEAALKTVCGIHFDIRLPKVPVKNMELPDPEEFANLFKGTIIELPVLLAMWCGMRMSEIRGAKYKDIKNGVLYINRVMVDVKGKPVVKEIAKTDESIRKVALPEYVNRLIDERNGAGEDYICPLTHNQIYGRYRTIMDRAGIGITFHDLRHEFASVMLVKLQVDPKTVQNAGGWKNLSTIQKIYEQGFSKERIASIEKRDDYFGNLVK